MNSLKRYNQFRINESMTDKIEQFIKEISSEFLTELEPVVNFAGDVNEILQSFENDGWDYECETIGIPSDYEGNDTSFLFLSIDFSNDKILFDENEIFWDFNLKQLDHFFFDIQNKEIMLFVYLLGTGNEWNGHQVSLLEERISKINPKMDWVRYGLERIHIKFKISDLK